MHSHPIIRVAMAVLGLLAVGVGPARSAEPGEGIPEAAPAPEQARTVIERRLAFLERDAAMWRKERGCAACHHGTMTVWALSEARSQGNAVSADTLADTVQWTKERFVPRLRKPRDPRPGWSLVSVPAIYLGVMSQGLPVLSRAEVNDVAVHLARHQEEDGAWLMPPPSNGAPPTWESRETLALWAYLAWEPFVPPDSQEAAAARASRERAAAWLGGMPPTETTQTMALRLLLDVRTGRSAEQLESGIERLLRLQNSDGGWSQVKDLPSDAYATGQALWALSFAGDRSHHPEVGRAVSFLVATQREDGSWPMTSRNHPGVETTRNPIRNPVPITYFGSAWATIGLVRTVPPAPDTAARQRRAFVSIRAFGGTYEVDEQSAGRPVVGLEVPYAVDDQELAKTKSSPRAARVSTSTRRAAGSPARWTASWRTAKRSRSAA